MNTNMTGFGWFSKILSVLVIWMKIALAFEGISTVPIVAVFPGYTSYFILIVQWTNIRDG